MSPEHDDPVEAFYARRKGEGDLARQVSWRAVWDQEYRFEVLCEIFDRTPPAEPVSILDVGCGLGDLVPFLQRRRDRVRYLGIDILPSMVEAARRRFPGEQFEVVDLLKADPPGAPFDYVLASGALSVRLPDHETFVRRMIERMLRLSTRGLAFNMQSARARTRTVLAQLDTDIYYADPLELYAYCRTLTPRTILREDFVTTDFAIFLFPGPTTAHRGYDSYLCMPPEREDRPVGMAYLYLEQQLPEHALAVLEKARETAEVANYRGLSLLYLGQAARAIEPLRRAVELDPRGLNAPVNLGVALTMLGRRDEAQRVWEDALLLRPDNEAVRVKLVHSLLEEDRAAQAEPLARGIKEPNLRDNLLGLALAGIGRREEGQELLEAVAARNPSMTKVRFELAQLLEEAGDEAAAATRYLEALAILPEHQEARKALRRLVLRRRGQGAGPASGLRAAIAQGAGRGLDELVGGLLKELDRG